MNPLSLLQTIILSQALYVTVNLDLVEQLHIAPATVEQLAASTKTHPQTLNRLLYFLQLYELVTCDDEQQFHLTEQAQPLLAAHPQSMRAFILHDDPTRWNCYGNLGYSIATGKPAFDFLYGTDYFSYIKDHPTLNTRFDEAMTVISHAEDLLIAEKCTFGQTVADIGGGQGQLLEAIFAAHPTVSAGMLFDLPNVIDGTIIKDTRITAVGGSFFEPLSITADTIILKRILHDWEDEQATEILKNIAACMQPETKLLIIEGVLDQTSNPKVLAAIDLALLTIFGGKERTKAAFELLTNNAGLRIEAVAPITDTICVITCSKVI